MLRFLERQGFTVVRIHGSHHVMARDALQTSVPLRGTQTIKIGTLRAILRDIEMSPARFTELWAR
jgi:predicted RNA binding protein YcfA (HicA-like mRNA interferase family)